MTKDYLEQKALYELAVDYNGIERFYDPIRASVEAQYLYEMYYRATNGNMDPTIFDLFVKSGDQYAAMMQDPDGVDFAAASAEFDVTVRQIRGALPGQFMEAMQKGTMDLYVRDELLEYMRDERFQYLGNPEADAYREGIESLIARLEGYKPPVAEEEKQPSLEEIDTSELSPEAQILVDNMVEFDQSVKVAEADLDDTKKALSDISKMQGYLKAECEKIGQYVREQDRIDQAIKVTDRYMRNPINVLTTDKAIESTHLQGLIKAINDAKANYLKNLGTFVAGVVKGASSAVLLAVSNAAMEAGKLFIRAVSKLNDFKDKVLGGIKEGLSKAFYEVIKLEDKLSGGAVGKIHMDAVHRIEEAEPEKGGLRENLANFFLKKDIFEINAIVTSILQDFVLNADHIKGTAAFDYQEELWEKIHDENWGVDLSPFEKLSESIQSAKEDLVSEVENFGKALDQIAKDVPEKAKETIGRVAETVHDAATTIVAECMDIKADHLERKERSVRKTKQRIENVKASLEKSSERIHTLQDNLYDAVDQFVGIMTDKKTEIKEYHNPQLETDIAVLKAVADPTPEMECARIMAQTKYDRKKSAHDTTCKVSNTLENTGKAIVGFAGGFVTAAVADINMTKVKEAEKRLTKATQRTEALSKAVQDLSEKAQDYRQKAAMLRGVDVGQPGDGTPGADTITPEVNDPDQGEEKA